jgi:biopolymer transport protein TolR
MAHRKKSALHSHEATQPSSSAAMSEINITPLIDVLLVLLIIFMVVTPVAQRGLDIALPQPPPPNTPEPANPPVVLIVEGTGAAVNYTVNKKPAASLDDLEQQLRDIFQAKSDKTIFIRADDAVAYGRVVEAMDAARGAGVERIGVIPKEQSGEAAPAQPGK